MSGPSFYIDRTPASPPPSISDEPKLKKKKDKKSKRNDVEEVKKVRPLLSMAAPISMSVPPPSKPKPLLSMHAPPSEPKPLSTILAPISVPPPAESKPHADVSDGLTNEVYSKGDKKERKKWNRKRRAAENGEQVEGGKRRAKKRKKRSKEKEIANEEYAAAERNKPIVAKLVNVDDTNEGAKAADSKSASTEKEKPIVTKLVPADDANEGEKSGDSKRVSAEKKEAPNEGKQRPKKRRNAGNEYFKGRDKREGEPNYERTEKRQKKANNINSKGAPTERTERTEEEKRQKKSNNNSSKEKAPVERTEEEIEAARVARVARNTVKTTVLAEKRKLKQEAGRAKMDSQLRNDGCNLMWNFYKTWAGTKLTEDEYAREKWGSAFIETAVDDGGENTLRNIVAANTVNVQKADIDIPGVHTLVLAYSQLRAVELAPRLFAGAPVGKLIRKLKIAEQQQWLRRAKKKYPLDKIRAVGTAKRTHVLCDADALTLKHTQVVVIDCKRDPASRNSAFEMEVQRNDIMHLIHAHIRPHIKDDGKNNKLKIILLVPEEKSETPVAK